MCPNSCVFVKSFQYHIEHIASMHAPAQNIWRQKYKNLYLKNVIAYNKDNKGGGGDPKKNPNKQKKQSQGAKLSIR